LSVSTVLMTQAMGRQQQQQDSPQRVYHSVGAAGIGNNHCNKSETITQRARKRSWL